MGHSHLSRLALRRRLIAGAAVLALSVLGLSNGAEGRPLADVQQSGVLRVAVYQDYKPYSWRENGRPVGIDVEIAAELATAVGAHLDLFELSAGDDIGDDLRNGVWRGSVVGAQPGDVMLHVPFDPALEKQNDRIALYAPYHVDGMAMIVDPAKAAQALDLSLFKKDKVAVAVGTIGDMILVSAHDHAFVNQVVHERDLERAAQDFEGGATAAFYGEASASQAFARSGGRPFEIVYPKTGLAADWAIGIAVKSDSRDLGEKLAVALADLESRGELRKIFAKYGVDWRQPAKVR